MAQMQWNPAQAAQPAPPGWYPDPSTPGMQRYWDGTQWVGQAAPMGPPGAGAPAQPPRKSNAKVWIWLGVGLGVAVLLIVVIGVFVAVDFGTKAFDWVTEPADTVNEYLAAVKAGDMAKADDLTCEGSDAFQPDLTAEGAGDLRDYYAHNSQRVNNEAWVLFSYETETESGEAVAYLEPVDGSLRICEISEEVPLGIFDEDAF